MTYSPVGRAKSLFAGYAADSHATQESRVLRVKVAPPTREKTRSRTWRVADPGDRSQNGHGGIEGMGWSDSMRFRDCPWCGLKHAQMHLHLQNAQADRPAQTPRAWSATSCPECGGMVLLETNPTGAPSANRGSISSCWSRVSAYWLRLLVEPGEHCEDASVVVGCGW